MLWEFKLVLTHNWKNMNGKCYTYVKLLQKFSTPWKANSMELRKYIHIADETLWENFSSCISLFEREYPTLMSAQGKKIYLLSHYSSMTDGTNKITVSWK